jgi:hypothetical protein
MNLNEALSILKNNNYLVEFLHDTKMFNTDIVIKRINKETGANFKKVRIKDNGHATTYISTKITVKNKDIIDKIREIAKIYNMSALIMSNYTSYTKNFPLPNVAVKLESDSINDPYRVYKPVNNSRLFIHWSKMPPEVIQRTGLRVKNIFNNNEYFIKDENYERRIYLSSLEKWDEIKDDMSLNKIINIIQKRINTDCENGRLSLKDDPNYQGKYMYLVKLPDNFPIRNDPEGVVDLGEYECDWVYTVHNIPPKYILYLASIVDGHPNMPKKDIIKFISDKQ